MPIASIATVATMKKMGRRDDIQVFALMLDDVSVKGAGAERHRNVSRIE